MISKFSVKRPITVIMITLIVTIFGVVSFTNLKTDLFPSINIPIAAISTMYFGASPEEIESIVTGPLESQIATVDNVDSITSVSSEHSSLIIVQFTDSTNMDTAMLNLREKLNMVISYLPDNVSKPVIMKFNPNMMPIMEFSITQKSKNMSEVTDFVNNVVAPRLESIEGVASVSITGGSQKEILINLDSNKINQLGLSKDAISGLLTAQNLNMPAGTITEGGKDYAVRVMGKFNSIEDIKDLVIFEMPVPILPTGEPMDIWDMLAMQENESDFPEVPPLRNEQRDMPEEMEDLELVNIPQALNMETIQIRLSDLGTITFEEKNSQVYSKVNGEDSITVSIQRQNEYNTTEVAQLVTNEIDSIKKEYPGTNVLTILDQSEYISRMVGSVTINGIIGAVLAVIILFIFFKDIRPTIVIGTAIPISIIAAFTVLFLSDITLNVVSMGGLALGIGMLVDNSVVVLENIYRMRNEGLSRVEAAIQGSKQVSGAIIASTLTTIAVFMPVVFVEGFTAEIFQEMALTLSITLAASLVVALSIVPMMSSQLINRPDTSIHHRVMDATKIFYRKVLIKSLKNRWVILLFTIIIFVASFMGVFTAGMELMPESDEGQISINIQMPKGTTYNETVAEVSKIEDFLIDYEGVEVISASVGGHDMFIPFVGTSSDSGSLTILLKDESQREKTTKEIVDDMRSKITALPPAKVTIESVSTNRMTMSNTPIQVEVSGMEYEILESLAVEVADIVKSIDGTIEVDNGIEKGLPEIKVVLDSGKALPKSLTTAQVAGTIRETIMGVQSTSITIDGKQVDIFINDTSNEDMTLEKIRALSFDSPMGTNILLGDVALVEEAIGYTSINRTNQRRTISITSQLKEGYNSGTVGTSINNALKTLELPEGYSTKVVGEFDEMINAFSKLLLALILAVILVYMIMASQFESLKFPFVIMFSIPLAFTGGLIGLLLTDNTLSIVSILGFIVLTGIVVNNGIVLIDYINKLKEAGRDTTEAILEAGPVRLRPILMTALTTILALLPSALAFGEGAEMIRPLGITVIGGLISSTILTLIIVPVIYYLFDSKGRRREKDKFKIE